MRRFNMVLGLMAVLGLSACSSVLTPEVIRELAQDQASFCAVGDIRGGAGGGAIAAPGVPMTGAYGQSTVMFCRSNQPNARISAKPDGSIEIQHGSGVKE